MNKENEKSFCITCNNNLQSFAYDIEKLENGNVALKRLASQDENINDKSYKRKFYLNNQDVNNNDLLLVNIEGKKVSVNRYTLSAKCLKVQKNVASISYDVVVPTAETEIEFQYIGDQKRNICVFDVSKQEEVIPACTYNKYSKELKGKFKLNKNDQYVVVNIG